MKRFKDLGFQDPFRITYNSEDFDGTPGDPPSDDGSIVFTNHSNSYDESVPGSITSTQSNEDNQIVLMGQRSAGNLLFLSLLKQLCIFFAGEGDKSNAMFSLLYENLCARNLIKKVGPLDKVNAIMQTYQKELTHVMGSALNTLNINPLNPEKILQKTGMNSGTPLQSWFKDMFLDETKIARGGFGEVVKVRNKLDQKYYAMKKVKLVESRPGLCYKTLREVQIFSDLNHPNIVRYHCSWLEYGATEFDDTDSDSSDTDSASFSFKDAASSAFDDEPSGKLNMNFVGQKVRQKQNLLTYQHSTNINRTDLTNDTHDPEVSSKRKNSFTRSFSSGDVPMSPEQVEEISYVRGKFYDKNFRRAHNMTLFIQMELCQLTLRKWMDNRNKESNIDTKMNVSIFRQLVAGLDYIHTEGLIHRDIKPANIFLNSSGEEINVKIGDFGLARDNSGPQTPTGSISGVDRGTLRRTYVGYTQGVGTTVYAAPEQKVTTDYTNKVDIFSAGIILFELYRVFTTEMEKVRALQDLLGASPTCSEDEHLCADVCSLILRMTSKEVQKRPSAPTLLLQHPLVTLVSERHTEAKANNRVDELERICAEQESEIRSLRRKLEMMESKLCQDCLSKCVHQCDCHQNN